MKKEFFSLEITEGGRSEALEIPIDEIVGLEVELDTEMAGMFKLHLAIRQQSDGTWTHLDDERFRVWKLLTIRAGFDDGMEDLISGYITHVRPEFSQDPSQCTLAIWGMDESVLLDREEKLHAWPNEKDSSIAAQIFKAHGLSAVVEDTQIVHDEAVSTIIQRETDIQFLKRLAARNGFECYVSGNTGFFRRPQLDTVPQPVLAAHFGRETNLTRVTFEVDALMATNVSMFQIDVVSKDLLRATVNATTQTALGARRITGAAGVPESQAFVSMDAAARLPEMDVLCQGLLHESEWFVAAEGEIAANQYGHVLKPAGPVTIKGVGESYSGAYYVTHVTHTLNANGYTQSFRAKRNALKPKGSEDFGAVSRDAVGVAL
jgi:phage protein D